jgi:hypothetical protein
LWRHFATSKCFFHEFFHVVVARASYFLGWLLEGVWWDLLGSSLRLSDILNKVKVSNWSEIQIAIGR